MLKIHNLRFDTLFGFHIKYQIDSHEDAIALACIIRGFVSLIREKENHTECIIISGDAYIETIESNMDFLRNVIRTASLNVEDTTYADHIEFGTLNADDRENIDILHRQSFGLPPLTSL